MNRNLYNILTGLINVAEASANLGSELMIKSGIPRLQLQYGHSVLKHFASGTGASTTFDFSEDNYKAWEKEALEIQERFHSSVANALFLSLTQGSVAPFKEVPVAFEEMCQRAVEVGLLFVKNPHETVPN